MVTVRPIPQPKNVHGCFSEGIAVALGDSAEKSVHLFREAVVVRTRENDLWRLALLVKTCPVPGRQNFYYIPADAEANSFCKLEDVIPLTEVGCLPCQTIPRAARVAAAIPDSADFLIWRP